MPEIHPFVEVLLWTREVITGLTVDKVRDYIIHGPQYYYAWWMNLLHENPYHVIIETGLLLFIVWLMFIRKTVDPSKETKSKLTQKEIDWLVETWIPDPLVPESSVNSVEFPVIEKVNGNQLKVRGIKESVLDLASNDFLGLGQAPSVKEKARAALDKYGCGSCGPRGFYGTIDVHLIFEKNLAKFFGTEQAICYSDGASAVSSTIPAYSKKGDLLIVDEACCEPIRNGVNLSRSTVHYFKHNDMQDLANLLETIAKDDRKYKRDATQQRRFIVVEGLYHATGDLCPLPQILALKQKYCYRIILDESLSFGTIGNTGRGVTEFYGIKVTDIDMITVAMDNTLASIGGGCIGTREVVDHQRLSGAGYCFSASAPPFLFATAIETLELLQSTGPDKLIAMRGNVKVLVAGLKNIPHIQVISSEESPVIQLSLSHCSTYDADLPVMEAIAQECLVHGLAITVNTYDVKLLADMKKTNHSLRATLHMNVSALLTNNDLKKIIKEVKAAVGKVVGK